MVLDDLGQPVEKHLPVVESRRAHVVRDARVVSHLAILQVQLG
jgi:hypothetical protein